MLKLFFRKPMTCTYVEDGITKHCKIESFDCTPLRDGQAPPNAGLIGNIGKSMVDAEGERIPAETLARYDLEQGLRDTMKQVFR